MSQHPDINTNVDATSLPEPATGYADAARQGLTGDLTGVRVGVVTELVQGDVYQWGPLMAGALLGSLPVAFLYSFFVEYSVPGMTGSVKE